jgi:HEAT repeat protein
MYKRGGLRTSEGRSSVPGGRWGPASWLVVALLIALQTTASAQPRVLRGKSDPVLLEMRSILDAADRGEKGIQASARAIAALGPSAIPFISDGLDASSHFFRPSPRRDALKMSLKYVSESALTAFLRERLERDDSVLNRVRVLQALELSGRPSGFPVALDVAMGLKPVDRGSSAMQGALRSTFDAVLKEGGASDAALRNSFEAMPADLREIVLDAIEDNGSARTVSVLLGLLQGEPDSRKPVLERLARAPVRGEELISTETQNSLRAMQQSTDPELRRLSALAAGRLHVTSAVPELLDLLEDLDPAVKLAARRALTAMSGLSLGASAENWRMWYEGELLWSSAGAPREVETLHTQAREKALRTLGDLSHRRFSRAVFVRQVITALLRPEPEVRTVACRTLGALGDSTAIVPLLCALRDQEAAVGKAASKALAEISRLREPTDPLDWLDILVARP